MPGGDGPRVPQRARHVARRGLVARRGIGMSQGKSWIEVFLMPLVVAVVGILGTYWITEQQGKDATTKADADRQIKILEIFSEKITSTDKEQRILALRLLRAVDGDLAAKLATAVSETEGESPEVRKVASEVAEEADARSKLLPRIYIHIRAEEDRAHCAAVAAKLEQAGFVVPGIERLVDRGPDSSQVRYFRKSEESGARRIADILKAAGVDVRLAYVGGYEESDKIRPGHYELWFAPGQPRGAE